MQQKINELLLSMYEEYQALFVFWQDPMGFRIKILMMLFRKHLYRILDIIPWNGRQIARGLCW